jgi:sporulation protein YlmC with PRC-barrel domain
VRQGQSIKLFSELRDLEIFDSRGELCGVCDEVELEGGPGQALRIAALLVGPGAYAGRLPRWLAWLTHRLAGSGEVRVPWDAVEHVTSRITLNRSADDLGLNRIERRLAPVLSKVPTA